MTQYSPLHGIGLRLLSVFLVTAMSAVVSVLAQSLPVGQIMVWRAGAALLPIIAYMMWQQDFPAALRTRHPLLHVTRGGLGAFSMALSFVSLSYLPVATAQALAFLAPILSLPLAAWLLQERLTFQNVAAVLVGFAGVLVLLWDALGVPENGALLGVGAGLGFALTMAFVRVHTKRMTLSESSTTIAFYFAVTAALAGFLTAPFGWAALDGRLLALLLLAGLLGGVGHVVSNEAVRRAPVSTLAPFDFTGLIWALGFDVLLVGLLPARLAIVGIALIALSGMMVTFWSSPRR